MEDPGQVRQERPYVPARQLQTDYPVSVLQWLSYPLLTRYLAH